MSDYRHHTACRDRIIFVPIEVPVAGSPKSVKGVKPDQYPTQRREHWRPASRPPSKAAATVNFLRRIAEQESDVRAGWTRCAGEIAMPSDANPAEQHLSWHRAMSVPKADARPASLSRRDNAGAEPVVGSGTPAPLEQALNQGDSKRR